MFRFRRSQRKPGGPAGSVEAAVAAFWRRWAAMRADVAAAIESDAVDAVEARVGAAVATLDRRLGWSVGPGACTRYALMITGEGDERLRAITDAWLAAAPADDGWEYQDAAPAHDDPREVTLALGDVHVPLSEIRVGASSTGGLVDVVVFHPAMAHLRGADREALSFVPLDVALGERLVERRIGRVEPADAEPPNALDLLGLRDLVTSLDPADQRIGVGGCR